MTPDAEVHLTLDAPGRITVVSARIDEGISKQTHARVEIAATDYLDLEEVLEADARIDMSPFGFPERRWTLRVGHIDFARIVEGSLRYVVNAYPAMWLLRFTTNTRKFRNLSAEQIVSQVLAEHGVAHRFALDRPTEVRKYCVQYRETNLDFILRLCEMEGIYYSFEPDGTVLFADRSAGSPPADGPPLYELVEAADAMQWTAPGIYALSKGRSVASGTATVNDYNWKKPRVKLLASAAAADDAELEIYDYPVGYRRPDQGERLARTRLEAQRVPARWVQGSGNVGSFAPARSFTFGPLAGTRFAGEYLLVDVRHDYFNRNFQDAAEATRAGVNYQNRFRAVPLSVPFRAPLVTPHPHITGCHTAMVRGPAGEEIHTDAYGRFRAQFHWDREAVGTDDDSRWLRTLQETQTGTVLARVGWEMSVAYVNGDPDRPIGFARNINGVMQPEYGQPANKTRMTVKTPSYPNQGGFNELRLEDLAGMMHFDWHAEKDFVGEVVRDKTEHVGNDETVTIASSYTHNVEHDQTVRIGGNLKREIGDDLVLNVLNDRKRKVGGDETIEVTEVASFGVAQNDKEKVGGDRKTKAGEERGTITRNVESDLEREVQGSWMAQGDGNLVTTVQGKLVETVAADKQTTAKKGNITTNVTGEHQVKVTGSSIRRSGKDQGYSGERAQIEVGQSSTMLAGSHIEINGERIVLEAEKRLSFKSGALEITLTPALTTIKGKMKLETKGDIHVTGNPDNITK
jgi:type VI secretion system secreted protein VgrG